MGFRPLHSLFTTLPRKVQETPLLAAGWFPGRECEGCPLTYQHMRGGGATFAIPTMG